MKKKITVKCYIELKKDDILEATIQKQNNTLFVDFPIEWFDGVPYRVDYV